VRTTRWENALDQLGGFWEGLEDPRTGNAGLHDSHALLLIAPCAVLCGGQGAVDMALFAKAKEPSLHKYLPSNTSKNEKIMSVEDLPSSPRQHKDRKPATTKDDLKLLKFMHFSMCHLLSAFAVLRF
jgi:hypothetical protein